MGKSALSSSFSPCWETGEGGGAPVAALAGGLGIGGGREEGEKRERLKGSIPPLNFREGGPQGGDSWRRAAAGGGGHGGAAVGLAGGQGE